MALVRTLSPGATAQVAAAPCSIWAPAADLDQLRKLDLGRQPGAYILVYDGADSRRHHYVGASGADVMGRARSHLRPRTDGLVGLLLVVGAGQFFAADDAFVVERLTHQFLLRGGLSPEGRTPDGGMVAAERYAALRSGLGALMATLRREGIIALTGSDRRIVAGPLGYRPGISAGARPDLPVARLLCRGVDAAAVIDERGNPHLQPGSRIRRDGTARIARSTLVQRLEAVYSGAVEVDGAVNFPMTFSSWSALSRFVTASSAGSPGQWRTENGAPVLTALSRQMRRPRDRLERGAGSPRKPPEEPEDFGALPGGPRHD